MYNMVYKTGLMFDQIRVINRLYNKEKVEDRDVYVVARSLGQIINIILQSDARRINYPDLYF